MTARERFLNLMLFMPVDRLPLVEWPIRGATMRRWISEGYPEGMASEDYFGLDRLGHEIPVHLGMMPAFTPETLRIEGEYKIWRDELGAIRRDYKITENEGFVTRTWLQFAVTDRDSFRALKFRYEANTPGRVPDDVDAVAAALNAQQDAPVHLSIPFLFWTTRDWIGFENLCMMYYDDPALIEEMHEFWTDFVIETLKPVMGRVRIDLAELKEDMAYKHAPMISPAMFKAYMYPHYRRLIDFLKANGCANVYVDCDGYPGDELTALWLDAGVDGVSPVEVAAGNDLLHLAKEFPRLRMFGGIDKRVLARTPKDIEHEVMSKVPMLMERGGYMPHIDHAIPHDVPLANYWYYRSILERLVRG